MSRAPIVHVRRERITTVTEGGEEVLEIGDLTVKIDRFLCVGFGDCIDVGPDLFEFDDDGIATFREGAEAVARQRLIEACDICPVDALLVVDASGEQIVP